MHGFFLRVYINSINNLVSETKQYSTAEKSPCFSAVYFFANPENISYLCSQRKEPNSNKLWATNT